MMNGRLHLLFACSLPLAALGQFTGNDDFADNTVDPLLWLPLAATGNGELVETNGQLEYTGSGNSSQYYAWANASYDEDFEVILRTGNTAAPAAAGQFAAIGIEIYPAGDSTKAFNVRHGAYFVNGFGASRDILANFFDNGALLPALPFQPLTSFPADAAIRLSYESDTAVFSVFYDDNPTDGIEWVLLTTFGVDGDTQGATNLDFGLAAGGQFEVLVFANTIGSTALAGELTADDFQASQNVVFTAPVAEINPAVIVEFASQFGAAYRVQKSTDLGGASGFFDVDVIGVGDTFRIVPDGQGADTLTGTGQPIFILDTTQEERGFYRIALD
jgi:hypothetical protein